MNLNKLNKLLEEKGAKADIIRKTGITRPTIDSILSGGDLRVSTLEKITSALNIHVGYLFDEEVNMEVRQAGRDYHEHHDQIARNKILKVDGHDSKDIGISPDEIIEALKERIRDLEGRLADKDLIIELLRNKSSKV